MQELPMTKEVASVIWAKKCLDDKAWAKQIQSDPARAIDWDKDAQSVVTVQNTGDTLNICVPDYKMLNDGTLDHLSEEQMAGISGGIFFLLPLFGLIAAGATTAAVYGTVGGAAVGTAAAAGAFDEAE